MRPKRQKPTGSGDLFKARLDQIINMKHELARLADEIDWEWIDDELADLYGARGRAAVPTRFMVGLLFLKHIYGLSDEGVCERWVHAPYFQYFTGEEFFRHELPHEHSGMTQMAFGPLRAGANGLAIVWTRCWWRPCGWRTTPVH